MTVDRTLLNFSSSNITNVISALDDTIIIFKVFPDIKAITRPPPQFIHRKDEINPHDLANEICSNPQMMKLSCTFATCLPEMTTSFFGPLLERKRLESHDYGASTDVDSMKKFKNVYLINFFHACFEIKR